MKKLECKEVIITSQDNEEMTDLLIMVYEKDGTLIATGDRGNYLRFSKHELISFALFLEKSNVKPSDATLDLVDFWDEQKSGI